MKKLSLFLVALMAVGSSALAKDAMVQPSTEPVMMDKEIIVMPEPIIPIIPAVPWGAVELRGGWDFWSEYRGQSFTLDKDTDVDGFELAVEAYKDWRLFEAGFGVAYQNHATRKSLSLPNGGYGDGGEYQSIPIYATGRYRLNYWNFPMIPYIKANLGYSFNFDEENIVVDGVSYDTSIDNGLYWGAGIGFEYEHFTMDFLYGKTYAKMDYNNTEFNNDYERVTVSVGYRFDIW